MLHLRSQPGAALVLEGRLSNDADQLNFERPPPQGLLSVDSENFGQHLGSFCFGRALEGTRQEVGGIKLTLFKNDRVTPWVHEGALWFLFYDDETKHWGKALQQWNTSSMQDRLRWANRAVQIDLKRFPPTVQYLTARIGITEHYVRHWHAVLAGKSFHTGLSIEYRVEASRALSSTGPDQTRPGRCPRDPLVGVQNFLAKLMS